MQTNILRPAPHLTDEEIKQRYEAANTKRHQRYWNLIRLMSHPEQPMTVTEAAHASGFGQRWARQLVHRYNEQGPDGYYDQRKHNPGNEPLLSESQKAELSQAILRGHTEDGSLWTSQRPRPRHTQAASPAEVAAFKKSSTAASAS